MCYTTFQKNCISHRLLTQDHAQDKLAETSHWNWAFVFTIWELSTSSWSILKVQHIAVTLLLTETDSKKTGCGQPEASSPGKRRTYGSWDAGTCYSAEKESQWTSSVVMTVWYELTRVIFPKVLHWSPTHGFCGLFKLLQQLIKESFLEKIKSYFMP